MSKRRQHPKPIRSTSSETRMLHTNRKGANRRVREMIAGVDVREPIEPSKHK